MESINQNNIASITLFIVIFIFCITVAFLVFIYFARMKIIQKEKEKSSLEMRFKEEMMMNIITSQSEERERIARNLHDEVGSNLAALLINLQVFQLKYQSDPEINDNFNDLIEINKLALNQTREVTHNLAASIFKKGDLNNSLQKILKLYNKNDSIDINVEYKSDINEIDQAQQLQVFRIIMELVTNSIKHGDASQINIEFQKDNNTVHCSYNDNGKGFNPDFKKKQEGIGLKNIKTRLASLKADYKMISGINQGFHMYFEFKETK